jgi:FtsH-binding integral membrane protein
VVRRGRGQKKTLAPVARQITYFDPSRASPHHPGIIERRRFMRLFMRLSSQGLISAAALAAVLATLLIATTEAFVGRPPKTNKILLGAHIGYATIIMISSVDTDQAEVKFKREFDDVIE